jgi:hypothetical protein
MRPFQSLAMMAAPIVAVALSSSTSLGAPLCQEWSAPKTLGRLDPSALPEASGLAISKQFANRLYHINDKGNDPIIVVTDAKGTTLTEVEIGGFDPTDTEEIALGPCIDTGTCLYVGDIGDNNADRESIAVAWLREKDRYGSREMIAGSVELTYPDGSHNAEAMVVHPNGDLIIFTKGSTKSLLESALPSYIYKITAAELKRAAGSTAVLRKIGTVDVPSILKNEDPENQIVTGASVSDDGQRVLLLTYGHALEMSLDLSGPLKSPSKMKRGTDFAVLTLGFLPKQEAISYVPGAHSFVVTSEAKKKKSPPIAQLSCVR